MIRGWVWQRTHSTRVGVGEAGPRLTRGALVGLGFAGTPLAATSHPGSTCCQAGWLARRHSACLLSGVLAPRPWPRTTRGGAWSSLLPSCSLGTSKGCGATGGQGAGSLAPPHTAGPVAAVAAQPRPCRAKADVKLWWPH